MSIKVWLIGGTSESAELARALREQKIPYIVTVTTSAAQRLYPTKSQVRVGALAPEAMAAFVSEHDICCILDASHPFATEISRQAIALSQLSQSQSSRSQLAPSEPTVSIKQPIPYLRYERANIIGDTASQSCLSLGDRASSEANSLIDILETPLSQSDSPPSRNIRKITEPVITVASMDALVNSDLLHYQRVLFTLGYRQLAQFSSLRPEATLFARVLPSPEAIAGALSAGFSAHEIIALRPPVSLALEKALWQQWQISRVVAKASGKPGGEAVKRQAARQLGVQLILVQRPPVAYPRQTNSEKEAIAFCLQTLRMYYPNA